jgi:hypothetical protein
MSEISDIFAKELKKKLSNKQPWKGCTMIVTSSAYLDDNFIPRKPEETAKILKEREDFVKGGGRLF